MATARLQYRVKPDGGSFGSLHEDSIEVNGGDTLRFTAASFAGWQSGRWEIVAYPPSWPCPDGWLTDASSGFYYYLANSGATGVTPPDVLLPAEDDYWGKWGFRLTVNVSVISAKLFVETLSPTLALHDLAVGEGAQFGGHRQWVGDRQKNDRIVDAAALAAAAGVGAAAFLENAVTALNTNGVPIQALPTTLDFRGESGVKPLSATHLAAAGSVGTATQRVRVLPSGGGTTGTGVLDEWILPRYDTGAAILAGTTRVEATAGLGSTIRAKYVIALANGSTPADALTVYSDGLLCFHGYFTAGRLAVDVNGNVTGSPIGQAEVRTALALSAGSVSVGSQKITDLADPVDPQDAATKAYVDAAAGGVPTSRTLTAGAGLTGGGDLSADRTLDVAANADGSIVVNANDIQVGVLGFARCAAGLALANAAIPINSQSITLCSAVDNSGGALALGANTTSQAIGKAGTVATCVSSLVVEIPAIEDGEAEGFGRYNSTAATALIPIQNPPFGVARGTAWNGSASEVLELRDNEVIEDGATTHITRTWQYRRGASGGWSNIASVSSTDSSFFGATLKILNYLGLSYDGARFNDNSGMLRQGAGNVELRSADNATPLWLKGNKATSNTGAAIRIWAYSGDQTAGYLQEWGDGSTFTRRGGVAFDNVVEGAILRETSTKTGAYTASFHECVHVEPSGGTFDVTLPTPTSADKGKRVAIKNVGLSQVAVRILPGSGTIDNLSTLVMRHGWFQIELECNGSNGWLIISESKGWYVTSTITSAYAAAVGEVVKCNPTGGGFTVTLPAVPAVSTKRQVDIIVKNVSSSTNTITIAAGGGDTVDGAASITITTARGVVSLVADAGGTDWMVV